MLWSLCSFKAHLRVCGLAKTMEIGALPLAERLRHNQLAMLHQLVLVDVVLIELVCSGAIAFHHHLGVDMVIGGGRAVWSLFKLGRVIHLRQALLCMGSLVGTVLWAKYSTVRSLLSKWSMLHWWSSLPSPFGSGYGH